MGFQWDSDKSLENLTKHGVDFPEAEGVFEDEMAITIEDPDAEGEQRFITIGMGFLARILVVVYTWRGDEIRLISARKANRKEKRDYAKRI